ncbi:hypothetical protein Pfo_007307 [Paulownia fortunei]|nr:hypothetical protein Pfo_007307 [Paulownia fortunei]
MNPKISTHIFDTPNSPLVSSLVPIAAHITCPSTGWIHQGIQVPTRSYSGTGILCSCDECKEDKFVEVIIKMSKKIELNRNLQKVNDLLKTRLLEDLYVHGSKKVIQGTRILRSCDECKKDKVFQVFAKAHECIGLSSIRQSTWHCKYCQNMFQRENFAEHNANAIASRRVTGVDPFEEITLLCIRIIGTFKSDTIKCGICR